MPKPDRTDGLREMLRVIACVRLLSFLSTMSWMATNHDSDATKCKTSKVNLYLHTQRGKFITTVEGLVDDLDVQKIVQHLCTSLHCSGRVLEFKGAGQEAAGCGLWLLSASASAKG